MQNHSGNHEIMVVGFFLHVGWKTDVKMKHLEGIGFFFLGKPLSFWWRTVAQHWLNIKIKTQPDSSRSTELHLRRHRSGSHFRLIIGQHCYLYRGVGGQLSCLCIRLQAVVLAVADWGPVVFDETGERLPWWGRWWSAGQCLVWLDVL